ncbi:MAG: hypothetical protein IJ374_03435 [Lachnospiraceae bacterium]|nr:hypothetical protein [Lachnospiraceae bacterium]
MKKIKKIGILTVLFCFLLSSTAWANQFTWENAPGHHNQSILLDEEITSAKDEVHQYGRGEYLAEGSVEIVNHGNGDIYIRVDTFAYVYVDRILHTVFLDYWDEDENDWMQVGYWEFEKTKEEANNQLSGLTTTLTLTGYETGLYYRVRGLHGVEIYDELEACATESDGVLITDN